MPKPTPASIRFGEYKITEKDIKVESTTRFDDINAENANIDDFTRDAIYVENEIRFHAVISEGHTASTVITKFPVQTGFEISNHAIKKNRVVEIVGSFTNTILDNTNQVYYSTNNSKTMFQALESLVQSATLCKVITNLGVYNDVVFNKFNTTQKAGMVDSMEFKITGEEIQVISTLSKTGPTPVSFIEIPESERQSYIDKCTAAGIATVEDPFTGEVNSLILPETIMSKATLDVGSDFKVSSKTSSGEAFDITYINTAWDGISEYTYDVFTSNTSVFSDVGDIASDVLIAGNIPLIPSITDLTGGLNGVTNCFLNGASNVITTEIEKTVDTAMGRLDKAIYGAKQDIIKLGGSDAMQAIIGTGLDCIAAEFSTVLGNGESTTVDEAVDEALIGIKNIGGIATGAIQKTTNYYTSRTVELIKLESPTILPLQNS